jgi:hypothetical protein
LARGKRCYRDRRRSGKQLGHSQRCGVFVLINISILTISRQFMNKMWLKIAAAALIAAALGLGGCGGGGGAGVGAVLRVSAINNIFAKIM